MLLLLGAPARAESGDRLWLRYAPIEARDQAQYRLTALIAPGDSAYDNAHAAEDPSLGKAVGA